MTFPKGVAVSIDRTIYVTDGKRNAKFKILIFLKVFCKKLINRHKLMFATLWWCKPLIFKPFIIRYSRIIFKIKKIFWLDEYRLRMIDQSGVITTIVGDTVINITFFWDRIKTMNKWKLSSYWITKCSTFDENLANYSFKNKNKNKC